MSFPLLASSFGWSQASEVNAPGSGRPSAAPRCRLSAAVTAALLPPRSPCARASLHLRRCVCSCAGNTTSRVSHRLFGAAPALHRLHVHNRKVRLPPSSAAEPRAAAGRAGASVRGWEGRVEGSLGGGGKGRPPVAVREPADRFPNGHLSSLGLVVPVVCSSSSQLKDLKAVLRSREAHSERPWGPCWALASAGPRHPRLREPMSPWSSAESRLHRALGLLL